MNVVAPSVASNFGDIPPGSNSDYGGYSLYGLFANMLGSTHYVAGHSSNEEMGWADHDVTEVPVYEYYFKSTTGGGLVHLCERDHVCTCETVDSAGVSSTTDTVYLVGSTVVGSSNNLPLHVYTAMLIMYKIPCGLWGGTTSTGKDPFNLRGKIMKKGAAKLTLTSSNLVAPLG